MYVGMMGIFRRFCIFRGVPLMCLSACWDTPLLPKYQNRYKSRPTSLILDILHLQKSIVRSTLLK